MLPSQLPPIATMAICCTRRNCSPIDEMPSRSVRCAAACASVLALAAAAACWYAGAEHALARLGHGSLQVALGLSQVGGAHAGGLQHLARCLQRAVLVAQLGRQFARRADRALVLGRERALGLFGELGLLLRRLQRRAPLLDFLCRLGNLGLELALRGLELVALARRRCVLGVELRELLPLALQRIARGEQRARGLGFGAGHRLRARLRRGQVGRQALHRSACVGQRLGQRLALALERRKLLDGALLGAQPVELGRRGTRAFL